MESRKKNAAFQKIIFRNRNLCPAEQFEVLPMEVKPSAQKPV
jgi:hypothetical protein